jgi:hypothetical protein
MLKISKSIISISIGCLLSPEPLTLGNLVKWSARSEETWNELVKSVVSDKYHVQVAQDLLLAEQQDNL